MNQFKKLAVFFAAFVFVSIAQADPLTFRVENVTFDDGGTLTGTFSFDPDDTSFFDVNLTSSYVFPNFIGATHVISISRVFTGIGGESALTEFRVRNTVGTFDLFLRFASPLYSGNLQSDIVIDPLDSFELDMSTNLTRNVTTGRVTIGQITTVPPG